MQFPTYATLIIDHSNKVLTVTINRPDALNALATQVIEELDHCVDILTSAFDDDDDDAWPVRGMIITGAGKAFVAGADIQEMTDMTPDQAGGCSRRMHAVTLKLEALPIPVIAAVNGYALGGGCELAMACDFIYASTNASFGQPEVSLGLVPGFGGAVRLQQLVGLPMAKELLFTGRRITAEEAQHAGLVNTVFDSVEELLEGARRTIGEIARQSPVAVGLVKETVTRTHGRPTAEGLGIEADSFQQAFTTADMREGTRAFLAKEKPEFHGS
ncbi:enoyl-CoA hydratase-related protein [Arthrobacter sp. H5]|uniref:enoyl-CoA hydratase/isomerase family protein n=1 Tax=Arthrobacter sp. H5 TaxID=1267973 RepID=UPI0004875667|nr:enoyl-CoA hydratase-related protein [Arthrobacter sp. H5]